MKDHKPFEAYFKFVPTDDTPGVFHTPWTGEVAPGRIIQADSQMQADILKGQHDWEDATKKDYEAQVKADEKEAGTDAE